MSEPAAPGMHAARMHACSTPAEMNRAAEILDDARRATLDGLARA